MEQPAQPVQMTGNEFKIPNFQKALDQQSSKYKLDASRQVCQDLSTVNSTWNSINLNVLGKFARTLKLSKAVKTAKKEDKKESKIEFYVNEMMIGCSSLLDDEFMQNRKNELGNNVSEYSDKFIDNKRMFIEGLALRDSEQWRT